jgi:Protein of unknown function (DUF1441)
MPATPTTSATGGFTMNEAIFSCGTKVSIRQISILTGIDRDVVTRRLQGLPSEPGPKNSRTYQAPAALRAVLAPALAPEGDLEKLKARTEFLNAELKQIALDKKMQDLLPADFVFDLINVFIKFCAGKFEDLRRRGVVKRAWINDCETHWNFRYQEFLGDYGLTSPNASRTQQDSVFSRRDSNGKNASRPIL